MPYFLQAAKAPLYAAGENGQDGRAVPHAEVTCSGPALLAAH